MSSTVLDWIRPFVSLSYQVPTPENPDSFPNSSYYKTGALDACLIISMIAVMAILRDGFRLGVLEPFAKWKLTRDLSAAAKRKAASKNSPVVTNGTANGNGHAAHTNGNAVYSPSRKEKSQMHRSVLRFAEQGWSVIYYTVQWTNGLYIHTQLPTRLLTPEDVWANYPHTPIPGHIKLYYLAQTAFYLHQVLILNAEARRKDHVQMMAHHFVTIPLLVVSYISNFTRVGCLVMLLMDFCDIFLPLAKMFRYLALTKLADITFVVFLVSWFVTRHVLFIIVIISTYFDMPRLVPLVWEPEKGLYFTRQRWILFVTLLSILQVIQMIWFGMICRVAWMVISGSNASDTRSDDESDDDSEEQEKKTQ